MPGLAVKYFVRIVNKVDRDPRTVRPGPDATIEQLVAWDKARAEVFADPAVGLGQEGFYLCRDGELTDRVCRGLDFWDVEDLPIVESMLKQIPPPQRGRWEAQVVPFHEDTEVEG